MGDTFAQKVLARAAGLARVEVGQVIDVRPHRILSHDNTAAIARIFASLGVSRVRMPEKLAITLDHAAPPPSPKHAQNHAEVRRFVRAQGVPYFFEVGRGICHQVLSEEGLVLPGQLVLGADSHTPHFGWLGAFGAGVGRSEVAALWATGELWLRVPESFRVTLTGDLPPNVTTKDLALHLIREYRADGALGACVEFAGPGLSTLSLDGRATLANMMAEWGVKATYLPPDAAIFAWLSSRLAATDDGRQQWNQERLVEEALYPDADAFYAWETTVDLSSLTPAVSQPHTVDNVASLREVVGTPVDFCFVGTCTNGRLEDIAAVAKAVRGKQVKARLLVVPASAEVLAEAVQRGYVSDLLAAGATIGTPGCGPCMGNHMGVLAPGETCISSANRNFQGRMGATDASIYLASPVVVGASAVSGVIEMPPEGERSNG